MNVTLDPYCPDGVVYFMQPDMFVANETYWGEHFWEDVWGTGLRPIRLEYL